MKLMRARKAISILVTLCMLLSLMAPAAFADTKSAAKQITKVTDGDDKDLGQFMLTETDATAKSTAVGDLVTITLPTGVEFEKTVTKTTYKDFVATTGAWGNVAGYKNTIKDFEFVAASKKFVTIEITDVDTAQDRGYLVFSFGEVGGNDFRCDVASSVTGDIKLNVETTGAGFLEGDYSIARVGSGGAIVASMDDPSVAKEDGVTIGSIKVTEIAAGALNAKSNSPIKFQLPKDVDWASVTVTGYGSLAGKVKINNTYSGEDTVEVVLTAVSSGAPGFFILEGTVDIDDSIKDGDLEVTVKGNEITQTKVIVAKMGDFDLTLTVEGDIPTVIAGQLDQEIADITISEKIAASLVEGRKIKIELPNDVMFNDEWDYDGLTSTMNKDKDEVTLSIAKNTTSATDFELEDATIDVPVDTPAGDLKIKVSGSAGLEGEFTVAKVVAPITATATMPELKLGTQGQAAGVITIKEAAEEVIMKTVNGKDGYIVLTLPEGVAFAEKPTVEVTAGDLELKDKASDMKLKNSDRELWVRVDDESSEASTVVFKNIKLNVDRTVAVGAVKVEIGGSALDEFGVTNDDEFETAVAKVAFANLVTPSQGASVMFTVGSTIYNVNGVAQVMDAAPYIKDSRTYVPVRYLALTLGVSEENIAFENGVVTLTKGDDVVKLTIGSKTLTNNDATAEMDVAPEVVNGRTMLPARFVAEAFGAQVGFANGQVVINK